MNKEKVLSIYLLLIGVSCVLGGYNIAINNGAGLPLEWLYGTPFSSYLFPGIILLFVVGGTHLLASLYMWNKYKNYRESAAVAGFGLLIWIFTEIYMLGHTHWLQLLYFGLGIISIVSSILLLRSKESGT